MVKLALKLSQGSLTKRIVQLFWTIFKQLLTPSLFALNIHVAIFWPCFSGRILLLCTYFTRPLKFYGNVFSIVLFFVLVLIPANILYVWAGICLWCFQDFHMKRKGRRLWNPDYFLSCRNYLVKRLRKEKKNSKKRERFSSNEDDDREVDFSFFCLLRGLFAFIQFWWSLLIS